jgi:hypothetical protein
VSIKKLIEVINNQVVITDVASSEKTVVDYSPHISVGAVVERFTSFSLDGIHISGYKEKIRRLYQDAGDELGLSVAAFKKMLNGAIFRAYIKPNIDLHRRFSLVIFRDGWINDPLMVSAVNKHQNIIKEYLADGIPHLAGFGLLGLSSFDAKQLFGKGLWKRLVHNSRTRNDAICKITGTAHTLSITDVDADKHMVKLLNDVPSTILIKTKGLNFPDIRATAWRTGADNLLPKVLKHIGGPLCKMNAEEIYKNIHVVSDAYNMIAKADGVWNPNWSILRMHREHDKASIEVAKQGSTTTPFPYVDSLPHTLFKDGFHASLCKSHRELAILGAQEHHCVGSYNDRAAQGMYAVYKITNDESGTVSTLGITNPSAKYGMDQHHAMFNRQVADEERIVFANWVKFKVKTIMGDKVVIVEKPPIRAAAPPRGRHPDADAEIPF